MIKKEKSSIDIKQLILVIGLTVILSVVVSIATLQLTGNTTVAWDDSIGGFPAQTPASAPAAISAEQAVANMFTNAEVKDGVSNTACEARCKQGQYPKQCVLALFSDTNNGAQIISCSDKTKQMDNRQYKITCICVAPSA